MKKWITLVLFILLFIPITKASLDSNILYPSYFAIIKPGQQAILIINTGVESNSIAYTPCYDIFIADHLYYACPQEFNQWLGDINTSFTLTYGDTTGEGEISFCWDEELQPGDEISFNVTIDTPNFEVPSKTVWIALTDEETPDNVLQAKCEVIKVHSGGFEDWWAIFENPMFWALIAGIIIAIIGIAFGMKKK